MRDLILGTAGHIDHGKTSLVKALTGIDCDRLPEEKARGITIDIGFAHLELGAVRLGIVDVPGHERFVKNMLAGATGIDLALLVVAADDSVMPQTREHLEILKLLRVRYGLIALTKADLVDETTREVVGLELRELVQGSFLEHAPIVHTSAHTGLGIAELRAALAGLCATVQQRTGAEWLRLPIDRAFVVQGHGTVVTGSIVSGSVATGDELEWHKGDGTSERVRVRGLNNHGRPVEEVHRGQRAAVNLAGVPHEAVRRGQELARPGYLAASKVVTVRLTVPADGTHAIKHRLPVRLHVGTAEVMATVSLLDCDTVPPGQWGLAQLFLEDPVTVVWGQPFVVRDSSAERTLGGGQVLQPSATKVRRRHTEAIEQIERLWSDAPETRTLATAWFAGFHGFTPDDLVRAAGAEPEHVGPLVSGLISAGKLIPITLAANHTLLVHPDRIAELETRILGTLAMLHADHPLVTNHDRQKVLARLDYVGDEQLLQAVTDRLIRAKKVVGDARRIARADFKPKLSVNQRKLKDKIVDAHTAGGFTPPEPKEFANQAGGNAAALGDIFEVACAEGFLVRITSEFYLSAEAEAEMRRRVTERLTTGPGATVAEIRDLLGTTRKYAVPVCEYLDRIGLTRRAGDLRVLVR
ncbi:selenocysteine-specific translation elongation factor [Gemmata sp. JC673]|uniref:Selenocysteine-specific elongation factor n=1 Tax=Gemmata algarum TaxID=2975278 RepID=A0ABU5EYQ0_9BACT|nr:selenocysteine-specific translation elongation factor [Gemmata algarum]MDY3560074.1 selenocysteine-specific translation elongation factor [Gemmata algarum]